MKTEFGTGRVDDAAGMSGWVDMDEKQSAGLTVGVEWQRECSDMHGSKYSLSMHMMF